MFLLIIFAFLAGVVTILSPCILPILPIVLSGSLAGGKKRPLGIVTGFILSFTFFTLALTAIVKVTGVSADFLRNFAVLVILLFGVSLLIPQTQALLEKLFATMSNMMPKANQSEGFISGILVGLSLGLIWAPCVGPILAAVITLAATSSVSLAAVFITLAYSIGSAIPMLAITYGGRQLLQKVPWLLANTGKIQKVFGVLMVATAVAIYFNVDRQFQVFILTKFPQYGTGLTIFEQNSAVQSELTKLKTTTTNVSDTVANTVANDAQLLDTAQSAPDFTGGGTWLNSQPLSLKKDLQGKVVLVDFWTYSCINCIRTLPYLRKWYDTYKDQGFVIVGVHSPEFAFEKKTENVAKALKDLQVTWPVVQDNDLKIWSAYNNEFWPAHYLIDQKGKIRYTHFGEGNYVETENAIRKLLSEKPVDAAEPVVPAHQQTPETYLGWGRGQSYTTENAIKTDQTATYDFRGSLPDDAVGLKGDWAVMKEYIQAKTDGSVLSLNFTGQQVFLVMDKAPNAPLSSMKVLMDGVPLPQKYWTKDMDTEGNIMVDSPRKYDVVDLHNDVGRHTIQLVFPNGAMAFAFTFG